MKKYIYFYWEHEDAGGDGVCLSTEFDPTGKIHERARFNTMKELVNIMMRDRFYYTCTKEAHKAAKALLYGAGDYAKYLVNCKEENRNGKTR